MLWHIWNRYLRDFQTVSNTVSTGLIDQCSISYERRDVSLWNRWPATRLVISIISYSIRTSKQWTGLKIRLIWTNWYERHWAYLEVLSRQDRNGIMTSWVLTIMTIISQKNGIKHHKHLFPTVCKSKQHWLQVVSMLILTMEFTLLWFLDFGCLWDKNLEIQFRFSKI